MKDLLYNRWLQRLIVVVHIMAVIGLIYDYGFALTQPIRIMIMTLYFFCIDHGVDLYGFEFG